MKLFATLREKPWIHDPQLAAAGPELTLRDPQAAARVALRFFLAVVGVLFFLLFVFWVGYHRLTAIIESADDAQFVF